MIAAVSWVPKGASKSVPTVADPPSKEEIEELLKSGALEIRLAWRCFSLFFFFRRFKYQVLCDWLVLS